MSKICRKHFKHLAECPDITVNLWMKCLSYWAAHSKKTAFFPMLAIPVISSETQRKSVGLGKTGANVFKDGWESPGMLLLKKTSSTTHSNAWLCLTFCAKSKTSIYRATVVNFSYEGVYLQSWLFAEDRRTCQGCAGQLSSRRVFKENGGHKIKDIP